MNWLSAPIRSVAQVVTGNTPPKSDDANYGHDVPWVKPPELGSTEPIVATSEMLSAQGAEKARVLPKDAVLVSCIGSIGRVGIAGVPLATNQQINAVVCGPALLPRFAMYWFMHSADALSAAANNAVVPILNKGNFEKMAIPVWPLGEQFRIVELLDEADRLRRLRREADAKAARILPALFLKMFGDPATNPMGWPVVPLSDFANSVSRRNPSTSPDEPFQYIDIAGVDGELGLITIAKKMVGRDAPSRARQIVRWRDTVVSTVRPYLRATALVPQELDNEIASTGFCVLRPREPSGYAWLFQLTRLQWFTEQLNVRARGASYPAVTDADIFQLPIPLPCDSKLFDQFDDQFESVTRVLLTAGAASEKVDTAFNLMLQRAFSGELTAKWREGHIQELLAEMTRQAHALNLPMPRELEALS